MLKKEFDKKSVTRARNLIKGKGNLGNNVQSGYTKETNIHIEGDIWEENGKTWTIKDGIKQTINKLDNIRKLAIIPIFCPSCKNKMNSFQDKKFYGLHGTCMNCAVEKETKIRAKGRKEWDKYVENILRKNIDTDAKEFESYLNELLYNPNIGFVSEYGEIQKMFGGLSKTEIKQMISDIKNFRIKLYENE